MAKKEKFIKAFADYLDKNNIKNKNDIILKYEKLFEDKIKKREKIKNILTEFGSFEEIIKREQKIKRKFLLKDVIEYLKNLFIKIYNKIKNNMKKLLINKEENNNNRVKKDLSKVSLFEKILLVFYKIVLYILIFALSICLIWISTIFVASVFMYLDGVRLLGINFFLLSILILFIWILVLLNRITTNRKIYFKQNLFIFIGLLIFVGSSLGISLVQYYNIEQINDISNKYSFTSIEKTYKLPQENKKYYLYFNSWYKNKYIINYDDSLDNNIKIKINYYECLYDVYLKNKSESLYISLKRDYRDILSLYIENLKENKIYDIKELSRDIINIYINKKDYERLVIID